ncbi:nucleoporin NUP35-like isoform X2 [Ranitomeya imitator]|uniref:nucleoporin NUP35-like isoform X2 n=1 Tax=Ranitomeya imitator TaxID=111125 RepID=UPI0037E81B7D
MAAFLLESVGGESMTMGSPTSPKPGVNAQFLPGFLMGDLPAPIAPQPRPSLSFMESRSPLLGGGSPPQPMVPSRKEKSGAPPVGSIYDDVLLPGLNTTPLSSRRLTNFNAEMPSSPSTPYAHSRAFSPSTMIQSRKALSPAQLDPFHTQGDALTSNNHLDDTWVTVYGFPQASSSYILLQFAQYGNIIKHVNLMESTEKAPVSSVYSCVTPRVKSISSPRSGMRPLAAAYRATTSPYKVFMNRQTPKKDNTLVSKALEYLFGW